MTDLKKKYFSETGLKLPFKNKQNNGLKGKWLLDEGLKYCRMLPLKHSAIHSICIKAA